MRILTQAGVEDVELETFAERSEVGSFWNAVQRFLYTGETDELDRYRDVRVAGRLLLTDPDEIERLAMIGDLDVDDIYGDQP
jgi:hypothetical protein